MPSTYAHPIGALSEAGVLDVGLRCPHSCTFCYYSYWDGSDDQFRGMRKAPWRSRLELRATLDDFRTWGLRRFDVTGGEPTLHPDLPELMRYAHRDLGLHARIITLGQFLTRRLRRSPTLLIDELLDAGVREYLFSVHAVTEERFQAITGESFAALEGSLAAAEARGLLYSTNTVVHGGNVDHLPAVARFLAARPVHVANFIVMKVEFSWANERSEAIRRKARYADVAPYLREAVEVCEAAGIGVNVRYGPYCAYPGLEKNLVGFKGVQLDPYEWRNGLRGGEGEGPYGKAPFLFYRTLEDYLARHPRDVETGAGYNMTFGPPCAACALRPICDGVDRDYVATHGWDEFRPHAGAPIEDIAHFRRANPGAFAMLAPAPAPARRSASAARAEQRA
jgi:pyrroloquinoline quinone biosynthesis protein E